jgi:hypothetical protein
MTFMTYALRDLSDTSAFLPFVDQQYGGLCIVVWIT